MKLILITVLFLTSLSTIAGPKNKAQVIAANSLGEVKLGELYENVIISPYGGQEWTLVVPADGTYKFSLTNLKSDIGLRLFNVEQSVRLECDDFDDSTEEVCEFNIPAGFYFLLVDEWGKIISSYDLRVSEVLR